MLSAAAGRALGYREATALLWPGPTQRLSKLCIRMLLLTTYCTWHSEPSADQSPAAAAKKKKSKKAKAVAAVAAASEQVQEAVQAAPPAAKKATAKAAVQVIFSVLLSCCRCKDKVVSSSGIILVFQACFEGCLSWIVWCRQ